jgi:hypothetical protein
VNLDLENDCDFWVTAGFFLPFRRWVLNPVPAPPPIGYLAVTPHYPIFNTSVFQFAIIVIVKATRFFSRWRKKGIKKWRNPPN